MAADSSSYSNLSQKSHYYDVFLNFMGEDTRRTFTDHLLAALERKNLHTFRDDTKLRRGENINDELLTAIQDSKVSIVVFSRNYATSKWCLDELEKIMECRRSTKQMVLPVFYDVEPSDVLAHDGCYADALAEHEMCCNKVEAWRAALFQAANLSGYDFTNSANGQEPKFIERIVEDVLEKLNPIQLSVADYPIGLEPRLSHLHKLLDFESNDVRFLAIYGVGGIGKTTLAKALYNRLHHQFDGHVFLGNVQETSKQPDGIVSLQRMFLSSITRNNTHNKIENEHHGIKILEKRVWGRKVFIVLDDVDSVKQLRALAINRDRFCAGSRIIITTRDMSALKSLQLNEDVEMYDVPEMDAEESLQLFSWHAFNNSKPLEEYTKLSHRVVEYARGLPLVLETLGSFLSDKSLPEWGYELKKLDKIHHGDVHGSLHIQNLISKFFLVDALL